MNAKMAITLTALLAGTAGYAAPDAGAAVEHKVTVCFESEPILGVGIQARSIASDIFNAIGLMIDWRRGLRNCPSQGIMISFTDHTPASLKPRALAYALPYEGRHIEVFYDRITDNYNQSLVSRVLGHVLAHEITHMLQGVIRHSEHGIMKARWTTGDIADMAWKPLVFEKQDVDLIYRGLAAREARALVATNVTPGPIAAQ